MRLVSAVRRARGAPFGRSSPSRVSIRPRCGRRASRRSAWRWRWRGRGRPALCLGIRAVHLMELLEDAGLVLFGNAWPRIGHADVEVAVDRLGGNAHLASVGELDGVTHEVEEHLGQALLIAKPYGQGLCHLVLEGQL